MAARCSVRRFSSTGALSSGRASLPVMAPDGERRLGSHVLRSTDVLDGEVSSIAGRNGGYGVAVIDDATEHRFEVLDVGRLVAEGGRHNDRMTFIHGDLRVVGLQEAPSRFMIRLSGSVKLRCASGLGVPDGSADGVFRGNSLSTAGGSGRHRRGLPLVDRAARPASYKSRAASMRSSARQPCCVGHQPSRPTRPRVLWRFPARARHGARGSSRVDLLDARAPRARSRPRAARPRVGPLRRANPMARGPPAAWREAHRTRARRW